MKKSTISAVIITKDEELNIENCLKAVERADEIIIVDSNSRDRTVEIARKYTAKIYEIEWRGFAAQKDYGFQKANSDWILSIDADEIVSGELWQEITQAVSADDYNGYYIPRLTKFLDKWIKYCGWYPGYVLRLLRKGSGRIVLKQVHEYIEVNGKVGYLKNPLMHISYRTIKEYLDRLNLYTDLSVKDIDEKNKLSKNIQKVSKKNLLLRPLKIFWKMFFKQKGFKDGMHGFILCVFSAFSEFITFVKYRENYLLKKEN